MCEKGGQIIIRITSSLGDNCFVAEHVATPLGFPDFNVRSPFQIVISNTVDVDVKVGMVYRVFILECEPLLAEVLKEETGEPNLIWRD